MKISIGADHAGFECKQEIIGHLKKLGYEIIDHGTQSEDSVDYPDFIHPVGNDIDLAKADLGIVICGSGNGSAIVANKHKSVRCALCWNTELAKLARAHNHANVLSIPARFVSTTLAMEIADMFIQSEFEGGRHAKRVDKI
ncbi:MAG: ribose 5-phosphate isomerase B [Bacteroidota bacterium]|nr:ribose 5-phosphate isomerase B [Bacteroidota bacterium]